MLIFPKRMYSTSVPRRRWNEAAWWCCIGTKEVKQRSYAKSLAMMARWVGGGLLLWQRRRASSQLVWSGLGRAFLNRHFDWSQGGNIGSVGLKSQWCCQTQSLWYLALKWRLVSNFVPLGVGISLSTPSRWIDCFIVVVDDGDQIHRWGINRLNLMSFCWGIVL